MNHSHKTKAQLLAELEAAQRRASDCEARAAQQAAELALIDSVQQGLASRLDMHAIYELVGDKIRDLFDAQVVLLSSFDHAARLTHCPYAIEKGRRMDMLAIPFNSAAEQLIRTRQPLLARSAEEFKAAGLQLVPGTEEPRAILLVPLIVGEQVTGSISLQNLDRADAFGEGDVRLLQTLAASMSVALENARLFDEAQRLLQESERRATELATINGISQALASELDLQALVRLVGDQVREIFQADSALIMLLDRQTNLIHVPYEYDQNEGGYVDYVEPFPLGTGLASRVITTGQPLVLGSLEEEIAHGAYFPPEIIEQGSGLFSQSWLGVPITVSDQVLGLVALSDASPHAFDDSQRRLLQTIATHLGVAIQNARLYAETQRRAREAAAIAEVGREISATLDLPVVLECIATHARDLLAADTGAVFLPDPGGQTFRALVALGPTAEALKADTVNLGQGIIGDLARRGAADLINDVQHDPRARQIPGTQASRADERLMVAPLLAGERVTGMMAVWRTSGEPFTPLDLDFLVGLARQAAIAIENVHLLEAAQESQRRMADIIDFLPDATLVVDRDGRVIAWNRAIETLTGVKAAEMLGRGNYDYALAFYGERRPILIDLVLQPHEEVTREYAHLQRHGAVLVGEAVVPRLQGQPAYLYATASALRNARGEIVGAIETIRDISDRKRAEEELRQAKAEAEAARQQADAANEAKSAFLATMSHEIRTPLNGVIGMTGLLLDTALSPDQLEFAETIRSSGETLLTLINDILDFSKIESRKMELEHQPFDLRDCLESALDLVAARAAEKKLDLAYDLADDLPAAIVGDVTRVRQVLLNLLSNAVKFTEAGEVVVEVRSQTSEVGSQNLTSDFRPPTSLLHFAVRDTGIGIPADRLDRLFQSFSQVDASTTRKYGGTGLGLAISKRLVEMMGGRMWAESTGTGGGSTFHFTLAAPPAPALQPRAYLAGGQPQLRGHRLLIVDDNATNRRILSLQARSWGMQPCDTPAPAEALGWIRQGEAFGAAIVDLHMPEMDGLALATEIRRLRDASALPLILTSSLGQREPVEREAFAAVLTKPIKPSQLFDALVRVLAGEAQPSPAARGAAGPRVDAGLAARHPLRILLAEDNAVNQKLALRLLQQMGYRADVAGNGLEAIEALERQPYDVVLMDVQMPEMDGLEAARQITRRWPPGQRPRLIAMTANAMQGDREMCLAAGMDDYLAKPIRVQELAGALGRAEPCGASRLRREQPEAVLDATTLDELAAKTEPQFVHELIDAFEDDSPRLLAELDRALQEGNAQVFRRAAHSLKSTGASLGAQGLAALAKALEQRGKAGDLAGAEAEVAALRAEYTRVAQALREWRHES